MRSKNAIRNLVFYMVYEILALVLGIIFPRLVILSYGSEINGLTSTITRLLSLINLIQAGAVGAAIFQMYKPVAENDYERQSAILFSSRKFYNRISIIYLLIAIGAGLFYGVFLKSQDLNFVEIFLSFVILAINGAGALCFNSICDIYLSSHQKKYYLSAAMICGLAVRYGLFVVVIFLKLHFLLLYVCYLLGGLVNVALNVFFYKKLSRKSITNDPIDKHLAIPNRRALTLSSIGSEIVTASPTLIITTFVGLTASSIFSVYAMIFTSMKTILNSIQLSFSSSFGNLVKTASDDRIKEVHSTIELITIIIGAVAACGVGFLVIPFVNLYSRGADINYTYWNLGLFVLAYTAIFAFRASFGYVATVYGLFKDTCLITLSFGGLGVIISLISTILFGMPYVMIGLLFNQLGCAFATLSIIKKKVPWFSVGRLMTRGFLLCVLAASSFMAYSFSDISINSWSEWLLTAVIVVLIAATLLLCYCLLFERKYLSLIFCYAKRFLRR